VLLIEAMNKKRRERPGFQQLYERTVKKIETAQDFFNSLKASVDRSESEQINWKSLYETKIFRDMSSVTFGLHLKPNMPRTDAVYDRYAYSNQDPTVVGGLIIARLNVCKVLLQLLEDDKIQYEYDPEVSITFLKQPIRKISAYAGYTADSTLKDHCAKLKMLYEAKDGDIVGKIQFALFAAYMVPVNMLFECEYGDKQTKERGVDAFLPAAKDMCSLYDWIRRDALVEKRQKRIAERTRKQFGPKVAEERVQFIASEGKTTYDPRILTEEFVSTIVLDKSEEESLVKASYVYKFEHSKNRSEMLSHAMNATRFFNGLFAKLREAMFTDDQFKTISPKKGIKGLKTSVFPEWA